MFTGIFSKPDVDIVIDPIVKSNSGIKRKQFKIKDANGEKVALSTFRNKETITGKVVVNLNGMKAFEHKGIRLEMMGILESASDRSDCFNFINLGIDLEAPGVIGTTITTWPFKFSEVELKYETYRGILKNVKYILRFTIEVKLKTLPWEQEFAVMNPEPRSVLDQAIPFKLEIGVEDWLLLYFHIDKMTFSLKDSIIGSVLFKNIGIKLQTLEFHIIKREMVINSNSNDTVSSSNQNDNTSSMNNKLIAKYQIMDGGPTKNETVMIRFPLKTYQLAPSYPNIANKFSVRYFMAIVLYDIEDRKYTKQHEIFMHRIDKKL